MIHIPEIVEHIPRGESELAGLGYEVGECTGQDVSEYGTLAAYMDYNNEQA